MVEIINTIENNTSFKINGENFTYPEEIEILKKWTNIKTLLNKCSHRSVQRTEWSFIVWKPWNICLYWTFNWSDEEIIKSLALSKWLNINDFVSSTLNKIWDNTIFAYWKFISITEEHRNLLVSIIHYMKNKDNSLWSITSENRTNVSWILEK